MFELQIKSKKYPINGEQKHYIMYGETQRNGGKKWVWSKKSHISIGRWEPLKNVVNV